MTRTTKSLAARWVFPIVGPPIHAGWVRSRGEEIIEVGHGTPPAGTIDLGDVALLPQLVNAHTHLEFSDLQEPIGRRGVPLHDWIGQVVGARNETTTERRSEVIELGIAESVRSGVGLIGDIATPPQTNVFQRADVDVVSFAETIGLGEKRYRGRLRAAIDHLEAHPHAAISPHAPYSTNPAAIEESVGLANRYGCPLAMHVAESPSERELLCSGQGPFAQRLKTLGAWQEGLFPWRLGSVKEPFRDLITLLAKAPRALLVHGNDLQQSEIDWIAQFPTLTVVFCPRTHDFFGYDPHPIASLLEAQIPVALGTDSRASNPDLNVWKEFQFLLHRRGDLDPQHTLRMATIHGAEALGRTDLGRIVVGAKARFGLVETQANSLEKVLTDFAVNDFHRLSSREGGL